jgi:hypothetical protein
MERRCKHNEQTLCQRDRAARLREAGEQLRDVMRSLARVRRRLDKAAINVDK